MSLLEDGSALLFLDGISCALLASAAAARARFLGAHLTGAIVLGCLCGLMGPLLREVFLHGAPGTTYIISQFPAEAMIGSVAAIIAMLLFRSGAYGIFYWLDSASIALASCLASLLGLPELGIAGAISLGLVNGLSPGLIRDMALGDTAMLIDKDWYAAAAAIGCVATLAMFLWLHLGWISEWTAAHAEISSVTLGAMCCMAIRFWQWRKPHIP